MILVFIIDAWTKCFGFLHLTYFDSNSLVLFFLITPIITSCHYTL